MLKKFYISINAILLLPHYICFLLIRRRTYVTEDLKRFLCIQRNKDISRPTTFYDFLDMMLFFQEYRSLFYARLDTVNRFLCHLLKISYKPLPNLCISANGVGPGLYIQHGFSTIVAAKRIGKNCWINQQVTIGHSNSVVGHSNSTACPVIGDNVIVRSGAKIFGNITVGDNVTVGANAVVVKNVPPNCTVVGVPAYIVKKNGKRVTERLK